MSDFYRPNASQQLPPHRNWDDMFGSLIEYRIKYGDCEVPEDYPDDPELGTWVAYLRKNKHALQKREKQRLRALAFRYDGTPKSKHKRETRFTGEWDDMFDQLLDYIRDHTRGEWPKMIRGNPPLANWVRRQRDLRKEGKLNDERIARLNALGMVWKTEMQEKFDNANKEEQWLLQYNELVKFHEEHGHTRVPARYRKDMTLGEWVRTQRKMWKSDKLMEHRKELLDRLGFIWCAAPDQPPAQTKNQSSLAANPYTRRNTQGDSSGANMRPTQPLPPPIKQEHPPRQPQQQPQQHFQSPNIPRFIQNSAQKVKMSHESMKSAYYHQPHAAAIPLSPQSQSSPAATEPNERQWNDMFQRLKASRLVFGTSLMSSKFQGDSEMGQWVAAQRRAFKNGQLSQDRQRKLESIQFVFHTPYDWNDAAMDRRGNGDSAAAQMGSGSSGYKKDNSAKEKASDQELFASKKGTTNYERKTRTWEESFHALVAYKQTFGDCNVPHRYEADVALGGWVYKQRMYPAGLTKEQRNLLESIGFDFETHDEKFERQWNEHFEILKAHHAVGNFLVNKEDFRSVNREFQRWIKQQRRLYKQGRLNENRVQKLNSIGFCWEKQPKGNNSSTAREVPQKPEGRKTWIQFYFSLVDFKNLYGHMNVTNSFDSALATWVSVQKRRKAELAEHQRKLMEDIDFEFDGDTPSLEPPSLEGSSALLAAAMAWDPELSNKRKSPSKVAGQPKSKRSKA